MAFTFVDVDLEPLEVEPVNKDGVRSVSYTHLTLPTMS